MGVLESALAHYSELDAGTVEVPEWGGVKLSWSPMTAHEYHKIFGEVDAGGHPPSNGLIAVRTLIVKAKGEDGKPAFSKMDENKLRHGVSMQVLTRVAGAILGEFMEADGESMLDKAGNG